MPTRILVVDDNFSSRKMTRYSIESNPAFTVCGEAANGYIAVKMAEECQPDVVVLDFQMPDLDGLEAATLISACAPDTSILLFTSELLTPQLLRDARQAGILEVVSKYNDGYFGLVRCLEYVLTSRHVSPARAA